jgi:hypothetical protein
MQQQAFQGAANLQTPGQFGQASGLAGASGLGSLGTAGQAANLGQAATNVGMGGLGYGALGAGYGALGAQQGQQASGYGAMGAGYGAQAGQAGANFAQQATNPNAVQAYMNPYLQSSLAPQIEAMRRQYGITGAQQQGQATQAGAFGGTREALMAAENNRAMNSAMDNAIAQGYNNAFQNAQQQQQFGANLGLQGQQAAMQGAGMGMQGAQTGLQGVGTALQGYGQGQQGLSTALQGYGQAGQAAGTLGQLGGQQLGAQKDIIGLQGQMGATQQAQEQAKINQSIQDYATQQQYPMMQLGMMSNMLRGLPMQGVTTQSYQATPNALTQGIGALGTGLSLSNALGGGKAAGGEIKSYAKGGIASFDVGGEVKSDLYDYSPDKLKEVIGSSQSETVRNLARSILKDKTGMAGGGIIAFADGDLVDEEKQAVKDRQALKHAGAYLTDVASLPATLVDKGLAGLGNFGFRVANALSGEAKYPTDIEGRSISQAQKNLFRDDPYYSKQTDKPAAAAEQLKGPYAPNADPVALAQRQAELLKDRAAPAAKPAREKPAGAPPADNAAPAQSAAYMPTTQSVEEGILSALPKAAQDYLTTKPSEQTTADIAAQLSKDREAFMGPDTAGAEYRKSIMEQRANAKDEAKRLESMRLAEFFSTWGSTPGPTLVAGMQAAQKTIPNLLKDKDDQKKAKAELDKIIYNLDRASRLEKAGDWEAATKIKTEQAKASQAWGENWMKAAEADARNKTTLQAGREQNISQEKQTAARNAAGIREAEIRATETSGIRSLEFARKANEDYQAVEKDIAAAMAAPKGEYQEALNIMSRTQKFVKEDPTGTMAEQYKVAAERKNRIENEAKKRLNAAKTSRDTFYKQAGYSNPAVDENDPVGIRP